MIQQNKQQEKKPFQNFRLEILKWNEDDVVRTSNFDPLGINYDPLGTYDNSDWENLNS